MICDLSSNSTLGMHVYSAACIRTRKFTLFGGSLKAPQRYFSLSYLSCISSRVNECMCYPWNMPKPKGLQLPLCTYFGNECITQKVSNTTYKMESCDCLPSCSEILKKKEHQPFQEKPSEAMVVDEIK